MKFKRIAAVTLTSALLGSFCTGAFADNNQTEIKLLVADKYDSDYVMTIPTNLTIESDGFNALSGLTVAHNSEKTTEFNPNSKVKVTATSEHSWKLTSTANGEIGYTLKANSGDTDATTSWEFTANEITNDGTTKTLGVDVEPYANAEAGEYTDTITFTAEVESSAVAVTGIELNKASTEIKVGENETLTATVSPEDATDKTVTWESSNTSVATVDENGKVTAVAAGTANITATAGDKTATCAVTVKAATKTVTWDSSVLNNITLFEVNESYTNSGITVKMTSMEAGGFYGKSMMSGGTATFVFSSTTGNIKEIVITAERVDYFNSDWSIGSSRDTLTWSGTPASSVTLSSEPIMIRDISSIVFTIEE